MVYLRKLKILCITLAVSLFVGSVPSFAAYTDVYTTDVYNEAVNRLGDLGIINGFTDGSYQPYATLTRAQFAKIVVCALDKADEAKSNAVASTFRDVDQYYWAVPYINYASKNSIIIGYADGTFAPEKPITYAEAITVLIRAMGYTDEDVGYYWPQNYLDKAVSLGVTNGISFSYSDPINRAMAAVLVDNVLFGEIKGDSDKTFLETVGYTVIEDAIVIGTSATDETLKANEFKLSDNSVYEHFTSEYVEPASLLKYVVINDDNDVVAIKGNLKGQTAAEEMNKIGYTVLTDCYIIASSSDDRNLSNGEIRTSNGVYKTTNSDVSSLTGEYGTVLLDKNKNIISASTKEAPNTEYIVAEVNTDGIKYVSDNTIQTVNMTADFPIYVDYGTKKNFASVQNEFVAGAKLIMYSTGGADYDFGVLETNSGYSIVTDSFIIASKNEDKSLNADQVSTSSGKYKVKDTDILNMTGIMGIMVLNSENRIEQFAPAATDSLAVTVTQRNDNTVEYISENGDKGSYRFDNTFVVFSDYTKTSFSAVKADVVSGVDMTLYGDTYGDWSFAVIDSENDIDPVRATKNYSDSDTKLEGITINKDNLIVYRSGKAASLSDIRINDVVYYNTKTNIMDVYTKKATGIYYDAKPSKAYVTSVVVGGNEYTIGNSEATSKLDASSGSFEIGERVTLLLGKNDKAVFAVELTDNSMYNYGVVLKTYKEIVRDGDKAGKSEMKADVFMPDGTVSTYVTSKEYDNCIGKFVKLSFEDGVVSMTAQSSNKIYGDIDKTAGTIGGKTLLKDAAIIQITSSDNADEAQAELLNFDTLEIGEITSNQAVTAVNANAFGDIMILVVKGVSLSDYEYGILTSLSSSTSGRGDDLSTSYTYKMELGNETKTFTNAGSYGVKALLPVAVKYNGNEIMDMFNLYLYKSDNDIEAIDGSRIKIDGTIYQLARDVVYYSVDRDNKYNAISYNELENAEVASVTVYSNVAKSKNGAVKAVVVRLK